MDVVLVVDVANVMGSRPDGWWRDRAGAATRLLGEIAPLGGRTVAGPDGAAVTLTRLVAVVEGRARDVAAPDGVEVVRAPADGDSSIAAAAGQLAAGGLTPLVVTADRGLRTRLPERALVGGPGWLRALL